MAEPFDARTTNRSQVTMLVSVPLFLEYEAKCLSGQHLKAAELTQAQGQAFLDAIAGLHNRSPFTTGGGPS